MLIYRYFIELAFDGTNYSGWQIQPNSLSVQQVINEKLSLKINEVISTVGAGRTDSGVHATFFVAHFDTSKEISSNFVKELNKFLPNDIVVFKIYRVKNTAHARFSATSRTYEYKINQQKDPFNNIFTHYYNNFLDIDTMNKACKILLSKSDFACFCKLHADNKTTICKVQEAYWRKEGNLLIFKISADRFLRNMVRAIVGTMIEIGNHKLNLEKFEQIIESKNRQNAGISASAKGLSLVEIKYESDIYITNNE